MIFLLIISIIFIGYLLINLISSQLVETEKISLGFITSIGILTFFSFLLNLYGFDFNKTNLFMLLAISLSFLIFLNLSFKKIKLSILDYKKYVLKIKELDKIEKTAIAVIIALSTLAFISSIYWPVKDWDSIVLYDFRAKTFVATGNMEDGIQRGYFFGYPLLTSLAHTFVYLSDFQYPGVIHSLFFIFFLILIYHFLNKQTNTRWAIIWTMIISLTPGLYGHAQMTYTNLPYIVYIICSYLYLHLWFKSKKNSHLIISSLLLGLSTWTRSTEPFWLLPIVISFIGSIYIKKYFSWFIFPIITFLIRIPWISFEEKNLQMDRSHITQSKKYLELLLSNQAVTNFIPVCIYFFMNVIKPNIIVYLMLSLFLYPILTNLKKKVDKELLIFSSYILLNLLLIFVGIYILSLSFSEWQDIGGSAQRMSMFIPPMILLLVAQYTFKNK